MQISLDQGTLVGIVRDALNEVGPKLRNNRSGWADAIGETIKRRLENLDKRIECAFGHGHDNPEENEWLIDFVAGIWSDDRCQERYLVQALIVGEIETRGDLGRDFDKLLLCDSLVCFFAFGDWTGEHEDDLGFFQRIAERRRQHAVERGVTPPPAFIIARYSESAGAFTYAFFPDPAVLPKFPTTRPGQGISGQAPAPLPVGARSGWRRGSGFPAVPPRQTPVR